MQYHICVNKINPNHRIPFSINTRENIIEDNVHVYVHYIIITGYIYWHVEIDV